MPDDERDEAERLALATRWGFEGGTVLWLMLAPGLLGAVLVIDGLTSAGYVEAGIGAVLLACTPFVARWVSGAMEPTPERD
jgi:hypothetical protein